jgi:hypothetical protein
MANEHNEKQDDDVVDEREGRVLLSGRFRWISNFQTTPRWPDDYRACSSALSRLRFLRLRLRASADFTRFF